MPITYANQVKEARQDAVISEIGASGKLEIGTEGFASILVTINLDDPAGTAVDGTLTFSGFPKTVEATASGTAAVARVRTGADVDIIPELTVGLSDAHVVLDSVDITEGQNVTINSFEIEHG